MKRFNCFRLFLSTFVVLFAVAAMNPSAFAKTFNVSTTQELRQALQEAAGNGQSDVIQLADGTYKTTDDGGGTFTFLDNEDYDLTIQGSSAENAILSGDDTDQVMKFNVVNYTRTIFLAGISVQNGKSENDGGGIYSAENLNIEDCIISENISSDPGGGFFSSGNTTITNSTISGNTVSDYGSGYGGGFCSSGGTTISNSTISGNTVSGSGSGYGGGFCSSGNTTITNSTISGNTVSSSSGDGCGGGFYSRSWDTTITNSTISGNTVSSSIFGSGYGGGFYSGSGDTTITNSTISGNSVSGSGNGGGFYSSGGTTISNSTISGNSVNGSNSGYGGGFCSSGNTTITNSTISGNSVSGSGRVNGGGFYSDFGDTTITNSIFINNSAPSSVYLAYGTNHYILNSIFINNGTYEIVGPYEVVATIYNNYIDESKIDIETFKKNNIFGGNLDFIDQANGDFHIGENSVLIDAGTIDINEVIFPEFDMDGSLRVAGGAIDIGPYEYSTTAPTINNFTYSGIAEIDSPITFIVNAALADGKTISQYEMDFGDGVYTTVEASTTHTYSIKGDYTVRVKITDDTGEFSEKSLQISISGPPADVVFIQNFTSAMKNNNSEATKTAINEFLSSGLETSQIVQGVFDGINQAFETAVLEERNKWDINGDGKLGIEEVIHGLKIITGVKQE